MKKVIFVCGPAGIGKSMFCQRYVREHLQENVKIVSSDETRKAIFGGYDVFPGREKMTTVYDSMVKQVKDFFLQSDDLTIVLDTTLLYDGRRLYFLDSMPHFDRYEMYLLKLHDYSILFQRNKNRIKEKWVPDEVIASMVQSYKDPSPEVAARFNSIVTLYLDE